MQLLKCYLNSLFTIEFVRVDKKPHVTQKKSANVTDFNNCDGRKFEFLTQFRSTILEFARRHVSFQLYKMYTLHTWNELENTEPRTSQTLRKPNLEPSEI